MPLVPSCRCIATEALRTPEASGMDIGRDCLDREAHPAAASIAWRQWRNTLVSVAVRQGFVNYAKEWWHFSLPGTAGRAYDFPVARRGK
jgi:D-alanyl-D-alanine dipeptidase